MADFNSYFYAEFIADTYWNVAGAWSHQFAPDSIVRTPLDIGFVIFPPVVGASKDPDGDSVGATVYSVISVMLPGKVRVPDALSATYVVLPFSV